MKSQGKKQEREEEMFLSQHWHRHKEKPAKTLLQSLNPLIKTSIWKEKMWVITRRNRLSERHRDWDGRALVQNVFSGNIHNNVMLLKASGRQEAWLHCALYLEPRHAMNTSGCLISKHTFFAKCTFGLEFIYFLLTCDVTEKIHQINHIYTMIRLVCGTGLLVL